jgi:hypothetical protein
MVWPEAADLGYLDVDCRFKTEPAWTGTIYFDDVAVE